jgi:hypothetical protein
MPEHPEVESFRKYFEATSLHDPIREVEVKSPSILGNITKEDLCGRLVGRKFIAAFRRLIYFRFAWEREIRPCPSVWDDRFSRVFPGYPENLLLKHRSTEAKCTRDTAGLKRSQYQEDIHTSVPATRSGSGNNRKPDRWQAKILTGFHDAELPVFF